MSIDKEFFKKYTRPNDNKYSPHVKILKGDHTLFLQDLIDTFATTEYPEHRRPKFLDIGGGSGSKKGLARACKYHIMDILPRPESPNNIVVGDIMNCPEIPDNTYDMVFSFDVFEHIKHPWKAARECVRITKPNGLIITIAPFAWRYHPVPIDCFRYSHTGMKILFNQDNNVKTLFSGYDLSRRRMDIEGFYPNKLDWTVVDKKGASPTGPPFTASPKEQLTVLTSTPKTAPFKMPPPMSSIVRVKIVLST